MYKYQFQRLLKNKYKRCIFIIFLLIPSIEILQYLFLYSTTETSMIKSNLSTFLSANTRGHALQSIYLWLLPVYLLLFINEDCIEDYTYNYKNSLTSRIGCKKYFITKIICSFIIAFFSMLFALLLNFLLANICFSKGTHNPVEDVIGEFPWLDYSLKHPISVNLFYILLMAFITGIVSMSNSSIAIIFHDRKVTYSCSIILWFILSLKKKSLLCAIQPFCEYDIKFTAVRLLETLLLYGSIIYLGYLHEVKNYEKIH